jgi:DNA-binding GntR family transcriptional regulator
MIDDIASSGAFGGPSLHLLEILPTGLAMDDLALLDGQQSAGAAGEPRRKGHLHLGAATRLRAMITSGELPPGTRLREVQLGEKLGVSRTPLREALRTLAAEGLVNQLPNRSMVVAELNAPDIEHLYRVFGAVEGLAGELAAERITEAQLAEMGRLLSRMVELHGAGERAEYMRINQEIHRMVIDIAANPVLLSVWQSLAPRVERARALSNLDRSRWTGALIEHTRMFAALAARDGALLRRLASEHFLNGLPYIAALTTAGPSDRRSRSGRNRKRGPGAL